MKLFEIRRRNDGWVEICFTTFYLLLCQTVGIRCPLPAKCLASKHIPRGLLESELIQLNRINVGEIAGFA